MPTTRKKATKIVYKDDGESESENADFSDSGSEAVISQTSSSEDDDEEAKICHFSENKRKKNKIRRVKSLKTIKFNKTINTKRETNQSNLNLNNDEQDCDTRNEPKFCIKDLTEADKLLPSVLNLSESDSSDEETPKPQKPKTHTATKLEEIETEVEAEYKDVWSRNLEQSEEIAQKAFLELEKHKTELEKTKQSIQMYAVRNDKSRESDVKDLLALGEEFPSVSPKKIKKRKTDKAAYDSDSDIEDWEEVAEGKTLPQQGLQLVVDFPDVVHRKTKKLDVEMMMKRKINRVKKEYQIYMHKVHVLCWLGHGNFVSQVLNDQDVLAEALSLIPSKDCYPSERVDMKYVEQITTWFKDKLNIKYDKNEGKYRPKAPPLKNILLQQIKSRTVTSKKYIVFIFVSMLRAVGLQCRIMLNFITLPIKPPATELCSLSTKAKVNSKEKEDINSKKCKKKHTDNKIPQLDGIYDSLSDNDFDNIMQIDGNDDVATLKSVKGKNKMENKNVENDVSPPKRQRRNLSINKVNSDSSKKPDIKTGSENVTKANKTDNNKNAKGKEAVGKVTRKSLSLKRNKSDTENKGNSSTFNQGNIESVSAKSLSVYKTRNSKCNSGADTKTNYVNTNPKNENVSKIVDTDNHAEANIASEYFDNLKAGKSVTERHNKARKRSHTSNPHEKQNNMNRKDNKKLRAKSVPGTELNKSKYFENKKTDDNIKVEEKDVEHSMRVSHRDLAKLKTKPKNDVTKDLVNIIKKRVNEAKLDSKKGVTNKSSDEDSDYLPEITEPQKSSATEKTKAKPGTSRKIDRRVLSTDDETPSHKVDTWCEIYVEELEQWIAVDVIKGRVHCVNEIYNGATKPVNYVVGWDNNNYLKDLTRRYVPHWNTVTRKQRVDPSWWNEAVQPWLGPKTPRDREEDNNLDRMQLDAPLPKSIAEYKNHPLYALKRHLLKFEAIYPPDAATLGFVRGEAVYARDCVYVCRSRDTWLKEAKVVRLGEQPYKVVKARPKWDKLSNKLITDKPLEVFGPWQVQDYEPPVAENGMVPRNAYGNVELFKDCMLPKGTVHIKLPGLNRVAKKLNIDCAPAMTGFDFNGGWSHPVYDGFVVCKEFEEIITNAWHEDQLEQERKELEKIEARVYGNWRRLIKGLLIRERLKLKYGFNEPTTSQETKKKSTGPRLALKKKCVHK